MYILYVGKTTHMVDAVKHNGLQHNMLTLPRAEACLEGRSHVGTGILRSCKVARGCQKLHRLGERQREPRALGRGRGRVLDGAAEINAEQPGVVLAEVYRHTRRIGIGRPPAQDRRAIAREKAGRVGDVADYRTVNDTLRRDTGARRRPDEGLPGGTSAAAWQDTLSPGQEGSLCERTEADTEDTDGTGQWETDHRPK